MRHVYLVENGGGNPIVFGTRKRARRFIQEQGDYVLDTSAGHNAEFWDNPSDPDDQWTIYRIAVE